ncbi:MAG: DUF269 domain-containing protein [Prochloraceae cyanobacterium]|nr:DUF269 domain-containing protein [Prochloraceae cyanobacterium]
MFLQEFLNQIRLQEPNYHPQEVTLESFIVPSSESGKSSDINPSTRLRISAFYSAVAAIIEKRTGHITETFVNIANQKLSSALVFCGGVLVVYDIIKKAEDFGFESRENLAWEGERLIQNALAKAGHYLDFSQEINPSFQQN